MPDLCMACGSEQLTHGLKEKAAPIWRTGCCSRAVCVPCLDRRPRLKSYCLFCQRPQESTSSQNTEQEEFNINDFLEEEPPLFDAQSDCDLPGYDTVAPLPVNEKGDGLEKECDRQSQLHYIQPTDTFAGIALSYNIPQQTLVKLNKLSPFITTTQPSLIHTRKFLLLPPGAKSQSTTPIHDEQEERRRLCIRHFQMRTKCADAKVAEMYINQVYEKRTQELNCINTNRRARGQDLLEAQDVSSAGGELDEAVEAYETDLKWEASQKLKGKYTGPNPRRPLVS